MLRSPYTRQECSRFHIDEGQEDSMWLRRAHEPSTIQKTVFSGVGGKRERDSLGRCARMASRRELEKKSLNQLENVT